MKNCLMIGISLLALTVSTPAFSQGTNAVGPDATDTHDIIVTATKRPSTLQDTPIAVSVTSAATIEQAQIRDLIDLQSVVPSLRVSQNQNSNQTSFYIRGFGNGANNPGIEPSVGVFIDGVYRSRSAAQIVDLPNIERVEVLRGPQSTLFGKNASAGVISVVTQKPQFTFGGSVSATYGNYKTVVLKADVTGPISQTIAFSLSGNYNRRDGYVRVLNSDARINNRDRYDLRAQLLFEPGDGLEVRLIGDYSNINELCCAAPNVLAGPTIPAVNATIGTTAIVPQDYFSDTIRLSQLPLNDIQNYGGSAQIDYAVGGLNITSITAYRKVRSRIVDDADFTQAAIITNRLNTDINTFTQELRVASNFDGPLNFLLGGYFFDEKIKYTNALDYGPNTRFYLDLLAGRTATNPGGIASVEGILGRPAGTFFPAGRAITDNFDYKDRAFSIFGSVDFKVTDKLTLTGGFNYTDDRKQVVSNVVSNDAFSAIDLVALGVALGVPPTLANTAANPLIGLKALQFLPPFLNFPNAVEDGRTGDSKFTYTLRAAYKFDSHFNAYASYGTGFKASSYNLSRDSRPFASTFIPGSPAQSPGPAASPIRTAGLALPNLTTGTRYAGPENAKVFEIGLKASFPRVSFNLALFDQTIEGFQGNTFTGTGFVLTNAGSQKTRGFEFEGSVTPVDPLNLFLAVTYLDAKYGSYTGSPLGDLSGRRVQGVSPITMSVGGTFTQQLGDRAKLILRGDFQYASDTQVSEGLPGFVTTTGGVLNPSAALAIGRAYKREVKEVNAAATVQLGNGLELSAYVRNLFNNRYLTTIFDGVAQSGSVYGYPNQPRTYGGTVRYKF